ncbi:MAG: hypothetical protein V8Q43_03655 [Christensenellaceae bacterium]
MFFSALACSASVSTFILLPKRRDARTEHLDALAQRLAFRRRIAETRTILPDLALEFCKIAF